MSDSPFSRRRRPADRARQRSPVHLNRGKGSHRRGFAEIRIRFGFDACWSCSRCRACAALNAISATGSMPRGCGISPATASLRLPSFAHRATAHLLCSHRSPTGGHTGQWKRLAFEPNRTSTTRPAFLRNDRRLLAVRPACQPAPAVNDRSRNRVAPQRRVRACPITLRAGNDFELAREIGRVAHDGPPRDGQRRRPPRGVGGRSRQSLARPSASSSCPCDPQRADRPPSRASSASSTPPDPMASSFSRPPLEFGEVSSEIPQQRGLQRTSPLDREGAR